MIFLKMKMQLLKNLLIISGQIKRNINKLKTVTFNWLCIITIDGRHIYNNKDKNKINK